MAIFIVLWNARDTGFRAEAIKEYGEVFELSETSYLLHTHSSRDRILEGLRQSVDGAHTNTQLVIPVPQPYLGQTSTDVRLWLQRIAEKDINPASSARERSERSSEFGQ
jgi:hypothetical protein